MRLMLFATLFPAKDYLKIPRESRDSDEEDHDGDGANGYKTFTKPQVKEIRGHQRMFLNDFQILI